MRRTRDGFGATTTNVVRADRDDFESACLLDRYFCKAENPPEGLLEKFIPFIKREAAFGYNKFFSSFKRGGFESEEVYNIALCYSVSFLGLYSLKKDHKKMEAFVKRYQEKNKTDELPPEDVCFKKDRSDLVDFLKQKIQQLSLTVKKKGTWISDFGHKTVYYKTQNRDEVNRQILNTVKDGYKGFYNIKQSDYLKVKKDLKTKKKEFEHEGWLYFFIEPLPVKMCQFLPENLENIEEDDFLHTEVFSNENCGNERSEDYLSDFYDKYTRQEKIEMINNFIRKSRSQKQKDLARTFLAELQE